MLEIVEDDRETWADRVVAHIAAVTDVPGLTAVSGMEDGLELTHHPAVAGVGIVNIEKDYRVLILIDTPVLAAVDGAEHQSLRTTRVRVLRIDRGEIEQVARDPGLLARPGLAAVVGVQDDPHLACNPAALAVGCELNRVQIAVLKEDVAVALVEDLLVPALAMVIRDHQQTLRANDVGAAVGANRDTVKRLPRMRAADRPATYRGVGHKGAGYQNRPRNGARQRPERSFSHTHGLGESRLMVLRSRRMRALR